MNEYLYAVITKAGILIQCNFYSGVVKRKFINNKCVPGDNINFNLILIFYFVRILKNLTFIGIYQVIRHFSPFIYTMDVNCLRKLLS